MKVLLIYPGVIVTQEQVEKEFREVPNYHSPLGILYLGQVLKDKGHSIILFDHFISKMTVEEVVNWIKKVNPEVMGFSVLSATFPTANAIAQKVKEWNPNLPIIYGGIMATFCAREILEHCDFVDIIVRGEGEVTLVELLEKLERGQSISDVIGISYRENEKIIENKDRPLIQDLDSLPIPDRKLFHQSYKFHGKIATAISTRGCPYRCRFCSCWKFSQGKWRLRSVENVIEELRYLQEEGFQEVLFTDDAFNAKPKRILKFARLFKKEKLDFYWHINGRVDVGDVHLLRTIVNIGCKTICYGIESANQRILDYYNKRTTPDIAMRAIKNAKKAGVEYVGGGFIIGAPTETKEEILNTINFGLRLQKFGLTALQFGVLFISPGTELYQEFLNAGYIDLEKDWGRELAAPDIVPGTLNREYLERLAGYAFKKFITNKRYIISEYLKSVKSMYRLQGITRLLQPRARSR
jgi:anaerobic magnesium-protoporphyrin IX monomethyl ester cyclase